MTIYCYDFSFIANWTLTMEKTLSKFSPSFKFQILTDLIRRLWSSSSFLTPGATDTNFWDSELHRSKISMPQVLTSLWRSKMDTHREALGAWRRNHGVITREISQFCSFSSKTFSSRKMKRLLLKKVTSLLSQFACTHLQLLIRPVFSRQLMLLAQKITSWQINSIFYLFIEEFISK